MSKASDIALAIFNRASLITVAHGYATDIGARGFRGVKYLDPAALPCFVLVEEESASESRNVARCLTTQPYVLEGHATCDPDHPNDAAHAIISDLKKAIFSTDLSFGYGVVEAVFSGAEIDPREEGRDIVAARIRFSLSFVENLASP
jgi:hypothetical protein